MYCKTLIFCYFQLCKIAFIWIWTINWTNARIPLKFEQSVTQIKSRRCRNHLQTFFHYISKCWKNICRIHKNFKLIILTSRWPNILQMQQHHDPSPKYKIKWQLLSTYAIVIIQYGLLNLYIFMQLIHLGIPCIMGWCFNLASLNRT